jgi:hypothetical protein
MQARARYFTAAPSPASDPAPAPFPSHASPARPRRSTGILLRLRLLLPHPRRTLQQYLTLFLL